MAAVVTVLSSDDEDNDDIQFVCEKPAEFRARLFPEREVKEEPPSKDDREKMKRIFPTLISTSVTISRVEQESPASPTDDRANGETTLHVVSDDSDNDIICLGEGTQSKPTPKGTADRKFFKSELTDSELSKPDDLSCLEKENQKKPRPDETEDNKSSKNDKKGPKLVKSDDVICLDEEDIPLRAENPKFLKTEPSDPPLIKSESEDSKPDCDKNQISMPDVIFLDSENEDGDSTKTTVDIHDEDTNDAAPSAPGSSEAKSDEKSDDSDDSSSVLEVSGDEMSVQEITDDEEEGNEGEDSNEAKDDDELGAKDDDELGAKDDDELGAKDDTELGAKCDNEGGVKGDNAGSSEPDFSSCEMDKTIANEPSCSKVCDEIDKIMGGPGNVTEKLLNHLLTKITQVGYTEENVNCVKRKIMKYYDSSPVEFTQSPEFVDRIKTVITDITRMMERPDSKSIATLSDISDKIKEFLTVFQRHSPHVAAKLQRLYKMYEKLERRIRKLEEQEVDSDSEYENVYVMQSRYEKRIVQVYSKICELQNKGDHADRNFKQEFVYTGIKGVTVPVSIQRALEKYYNKTQLFPDFHDVYNLVKRVNGKDELGMKDTQIYTIASELFTDFGNKLKRRRQYDDYQTITSRVRGDGAASTDPAQFDTVLQERLEHNRLNRRTEDEVLTEYVMKAAQIPTAANPENDDEEEDRDSELEKDDEAEPGKTFVDSDEEIAALENVDEPRRRTESDEGPPAKKLKTGDSEDSVVSQNAENGCTEKESGPSTKDGFLENCGLQPS